MWTLIMILCFMAGLVMAGSSPVLAGWFFIGGLVSAAKSDAVDCENFMAFLFALIVICGLTYVLFS